MRKGDFQSAWGLSDALREAWGLRDASPTPRHLREVWDGRSLQGQRVLIRCYHGLGDTIQFVRYVPMMNEIASEVTLCAQSQLIDLLSSMPEGGQLFPLHEGEPSLNFDVDVEIMELPRVFRTTLDTIPNDVPYLHIPAGNIQVNENYSVGIVWQAGGWDEQRSIAFKQLEPLSGIQGVVFFSLQLEPISAGWRDGFGTVLDTASVFKMAQMIQALDLIITVDTMAAHLAGALGKPVWTLLPKDADWRWMIDRDDSPWYPTMRLFRQPRQGDWAPVVNTIRRELEVLVDPIS